MPSSPKYAPPKKRLCLPLFLHLLLLFSVMVFAVAGGLAYYDFQSNKDRAILAAKGRIVEVGRAMKLRLENLWAPAWAMARIGVLLPGLDHDPGMLTHPLLSVFRIFMEGNPLVMSVYLGHNNGEFFQVSHLGAMVPKALGRHKPVPSARFLLRAITREREGSRHSSITWLGRNGEVLRRDPPRKADFDPRVRPWFLESSKKDCPIMTPAYLFESTSQPGWTLANRFSQGAGGVLGVDISMHSISGFLSAARITPSSLFVLFDGHGRIVGHPDTKKMFSIQTFRERKVVTRAFVQDLNHPLLTELTNRYDPGANDQSLIIRVGGEVYVAGVVRWLSPLGTDVYMAQMAPLSELAGSLLESVKRSLLTSLMVIAGAVPLIAFSTWRISRPLNKAVRETGRVRNFDLDPGESIESRISEIHQLGESMETMRAALTTFAQYVPKALVRKLMESGEEQRVGGENRSISILFTDVAGYTHMSEHMKPEKLMLKTSAYFDEMCTVILDNHGTIDKFIGDSIMAFWNAPNDDPDQVRHALTAMLFCSHVTRKMNRIWHAAGEEPMPTRMGLHCGEAIVGNLGSSDRMDYTVLGATVNLASRLEGMNKHYGIHALVSQEVHRLAGEEFLLRKLDRVCPRGTTIPLDIFQPMGMLGGPGRIVPPPGARELCSRWGDAFSLYEERRWQEAMEAFAALAKRYPQDGPARVMSQRLKAINQSPPPPSWDGVWFISA